MSVKTYYVVWDRRANKAVIYDRKITAIYHHVKHTIKQKVWFIEGLTANQVKERLQKAGTHYTYVKG